MCARFSLDASSEDIVAFFGLADEPPIPARQFNLAPTDDILIVRQTDAGREADLARWGLLPWWAKDKRMGVRAINARADGIWDKPMFRKAAEDGRRCLVATTGFFEWQDEEGSKQPYLFQREGGGLFAFAGLWERWRDRTDGDRIIESATVVTTDPNEMFSQWHDRMPVVLSPEHWDAWLDPSNGQDALSPLLVGPPDDLLVPVKVSRFVSNVKNHGPQCVQPVAG